MTYTDADTADRMRDLWDEFCEAWVRLRMTPSAEDFVQWCWESYGLRIGSDGWRSYRLRTGRNV